MLPETHDLYRLPWSATDNPVGWLEVTDVCNIHCPGCYKQTLSGHRPIEDVKEDVRLFTRWRNCDSILVAGGEPLLYPDLLDVVAAIREAGIKPILQSNGTTLDRPLTEALKEAGLAGFGLHVDSLQDRPGWTGRTEEEINELRQFYADLFAEVGGLSVIFNSTVYPSTFEQVPGVAHWALANVDRVNGVVFTLFRPSAIDYLGGRFAEGAGNTGHPLVTSGDVYEHLREHVAGYDAACYLGGTASPRTVKWLMGALVGSRDGVYGALGPRSLEIAQAFHHLFRGRYLAYLASTRVGAKVFLLAGLDPAVRRAARRYLRDVLTHPWRLFSPIHAQVIGIVQPPDVLADGRVDMCDGCPNGTWYDGRLVSCCRMDELRTSGELFTPDTIRQVLEERYATA